MAKRRRRTATPRSTAIVVRTASSPPAYMEAPRGGLVTRSGRAVAFRARDYTRRRGGIMGTVKRVAGLSIGGALGSAIQGTLQGLGTGPILSKVLTVGAAVALGSGAAPGSMTDSGTDGMIASAGSGMVFDAVEWWRQRGRQAPAQQPPQQQQQHGTPTR